jgi:RHS repeat-associated protein
MVFKNPSACSQKIAEVRRTNGSTKKNLRFDYDAMGNRIAKHIYADNTFTQWENSTYYVRDASGNVMATYEREATGQTPPSSFRVAERHLYGSARLGIDTTQYEFIATTYTASPEAERSLGHKHYEISNHLGNVLSVITDQKLPVVDVSAVVSYAAVVLSATDYSPFGVGLYGRSWSEGYRYGFNGKEKETTISTLDYGERIASPRLARFLSADPRPKHSEGIYSFLGNNPNFFIDPNGADTLVVHFGRPILHENSIYLYPITFSLIRKGVEKRIEIQLPDEMATDKIYAVVPVHAVEGGSSANNKIVRDTQELFSIRFEEYKGYSNSISLKQFNSGSRVLLHFLNWTGGSFGCHTPRAGDPETWGKSEYFVNGELVYSYSDETLSDGTKKGQAVLNGIREMHENTIGGTNVDNSLGREVLVPDSGNDFIIRTNSEAPIDRIEPRKPEPLKTALPQLIGI